MEKSQLIKDLIAISSWAGSSDDFVQAGGGNTSVKEDNSMFIKASGFKLSDISEDKGYVEVDIKKTIELIENKKEYEKYEDQERDKVIIKEVQKTVIKDNGFRPSVESFLHALLGKVVIHTHPVLSNAICCVDNCKDILRDLFSNDILYIPYSVPGYPLACLMKEEVDKYFKRKNKLPTIVFLGNHGLFITGETVNESINTMKNVLSDIEKYFGLDKKENNLDSLFEENKEADIENWNNIFKNYVKDYFLKIITPSKKELTETIKSTPLYPDYIVYCGKNYFSSDSIVPSENTKKYFDNFIKDNNNVPAVTYCDDGNIVLMGKNKSHLENIESVFIAHAKTVLLGRKIGNVIPLSEKDVSYIDNWESEKYRKNLLTK
jgi:rhamnose utilization protein RhaD (predicted bifunctional aldolase and dehydrogenase)